MGRPISERIGDEDEMLRKFADNISNNLRVSSPGIIQAFDPITQTATIQLAIREKIIGNDLKQSWANLPLLLDVPVMFPRGGGFIFTMPVLKGDECLVVFGDMCMDAWFSNGGVQNQIERRRHDLSDVVAIMGLWNQTRKIANYCDDAVQISTEDGKTNIKLSQTDVSINIKSENRETNIKLSKEDIIINAPNIIIDASDVTINANKVTINSNEIILGGITWSNHVHGGINPGVNDTYEPKEGE